MRLRNSSVLAGDTLNLRSAKGSDSLRQPSSAEHDMPAAPYLVVHTINKLLRRM
jgi:hypothetical protein